MSAQSTRVHSSCIMLFHLDFLVSDFVRLRCDVLINFSMDSRVIAIAIANRILS